MVEWWTRSHEELVKDNYNEEKLRNIIRNSKGLILRKGFREFFAILEKYDIPIVIFSGGIGDIIRIILEENLGKLPKNVHIISNWMSYDRQ
uniref:5'-nucleotidase n=1 Tax=Romanomermis culicivorax TaxID=13658 RepID=A0A915JRN2_ROMCU